MENRNLTPPSSGPRPCHDAGREPFLTPNRKVDHVYTVIGHIAHTNSGMIPSFRIIPHTSQDLQGGEIVAEVSTLAEAEKVGRGWIRQFGYRA
jgi:hypothetical protein